MASTSNIQTTPSSSDPFSCSEHRWKYQVFLSFSGETRNTFTSHLCNALHKKFIYTFKDDKRLEIGTPIKEELLEAIEKSKMAVIIISKEYASSTWCLEELAKIVECMNDREMKAVPIFYHVEPSDVRHQKGAFGDAFARTEKKPENKEKVQTWKNALKEVANHTGRHLKTNEHDEPMFIENIVTKISTKLNEFIRDDPEYNFVGMDSHLKEMYKHNLDIGLDDHPRFIGICGMSGMGKTTLARFIFQKFKHQFQARSFIANVSSVSQNNGLVALQEKLLSDMKLKDDQEKWDEQDGIAVIRSRLCDTKVLIVLDDVDKREQLETLAGNREWFGLGSRIIVTTKDRHLLISHGVQIIYPIKGLHKKEALRLFSQKAFHDPNQCEDQDFLDLCNDYVSYADGHPLTLKVLGSSLSGKEKVIWTDLLAKLEVFPDRDIQEKLKIGFDALGEAEKNMFLDIACFFNGEDKHRVVDLLEDTYDRFPAVAIDTLMNKSLLTILETKLWMHSLLQRMGREIVRCEHSKPGERSRLWHRNDICQVLQDNSGTDKVQGIMLSISSPCQEEDLNPEAFSNMERLTLIKICDHVNLPLGLNYLSNWLRLIHWDEYPLDSIPESFQPSNLVELIMHRSSFPELPMAFLKLKKLKVMDFSGSEKLMKTPDFSGCPSLQRLVFKGCTRLSEVHPSIGALKQLILLNLKDCKCLSSLPDEINLESLNILILSGCSKFDKFPKIEPNMEHLSEVYLDGTAIEELPLSIRHLTGLTLLNLGGCKKLLIFPSVICRLPALKTLILSGCKGQPHSSVLFSIGAALTLSLPSFFSRLTSLVALDLSDCNLLDGALPDDLSRLSSLESLNLSGNNFTCLPKSISDERLSSLESLNLSGNNFTCLPESISQLSCLTSLVALDLSDCNLLDGALPDDLSGLSSLESLNLSGNNFTCLPESISQLPKLKFLYLDDCSRRQLFPNLPSTTQSIMARKCISPQNYCNQVVVSTSGGRDFTDYLSLAAHEEDILIREVSLLGTDSQSLWMEQQIRQSEEYHSIPHATIPKWFQKYGSSIRIPLPYNLSKDSSWRGIVLLVVLGTNEYVHGVETLADASNNVHKLICSLDMDGGLATCSVVLPKYQYSHVGSFGLCLYISHARLGNRLDQRNRITARFTLNSPSIMIRGCDVRIFYEQDLTELEQLLSQKNLGLVPPLYVQVAGPHDQIYATDPLARIHNSYPHT